MSEKKRLSFGKIFLASLLALVTIGIVTTLIIFAMIGAAFTPKEFTVNQSTVLHMTLSSDIGDVSYAQPQFNGSGFQVQQKLGLNEILNGIEIAKSDDHVKGIFINVDDVHAGMATVKEIRDACRAGYDLW